MKRKKAFVLWLVAILMIAGTFIACDKNVEKTEKSDDIQATAIEKNVTEESSTSESSQNEEEVEFSYPIDTDETLTYYLEKGVHPDYVSSEDQPTYEIYSRLVGVDIEFIMSTGGEQSFNLLLVSGDLPDIIAANWRNYSGGVEGAITDQYIINLNDVLQEFAPNLSAYLAENSSVDKEIKTDAGTYAFFPFIRGDDYLTVYAGPCIRDDMLEAVNMDIPVTIDDWTDMLTLFKTELGSEAPLGYLSSWLLRTQVFAQAYSIIDGFYQIDGEVIYGPIQEEYKAYLLQMRQWYEDGLIDSDISAIDDNILKANIVAGKTGAMIGTTSRLGSFNQALDEAGVQGSLIGVPYPVLNEGETPFYTQKADRASTGLVAAISTACDNVELAARVCDFIYSDEGTLFANFGEEGVSYDLVDGEPVLTEEITSYSSGILDGLMRYNFFYGGSSPMIHDKAFYEATITYEEQKEGIEQWSKNTQVDEHRLSDSLSATIEETEEYAALWTEINTYNSEMFLKFLFGDEDIETSYSEYVDTLNELGLQRVLEIKQAQLDRFNNR